MVLGRQDPFRQTERKGNDGRGFYLGPEATPGRKRAAKRNSYDTLTQVSETPLNAPAGIHPGCPSSG